MKKYHLFLPLLGILLLVSGGCSKRKEPKPLITEAPAVETEIGGYITETESSTPESQSVSGTIRLPIQEPEHQKESSTESEVVSASIYIGSNGSFRAYPYAGGDIVTPESLIAAMADLTGWNLSPEKMRTVSQSVLPDPALFLLALHPLKRKHFPSTARISFIVRFLTVSAIPYR